MTSKTIINYDNLPKELANELAHAVLDNDLEVTGLTGLSFDLQDYGQRLGGWHANQSDPVYAVGSCARLGVPPPRRDLVDGCLTNLQRIVRNPRKVSDFDLIDLGDLVRETEELLAKVYPSYQWAGDDFDTAAAVVCRASEIVETALSNEIGGKIVTRNGRRFRIVAAIELREIDGT